MDIARIGALAKHGAWIVILWRGRIALGLSHCYAAIASIRCQLLKLAAFQQQTAGLSRILCSVAVLGDCIMLLGLPLKWIAMLHEQLHAWWVAIAVQILCLSNTCYGWVTQEERLPVESVACTARAACAENTHPTPSHSSFKPPWSDASLISLHITRRSHLPRVENHIW
jgi:hypothetical protein